MSASRVTHHIQVARGIRHNITAKILLVVAATCLFAGGYFDLLAVSQPAMVEGGTNFDAVVSVDAPLD